MKKLYKLSNLFEKFDFSKTKIKITGSQSSPTDEILVKWTYQYSWPQDNQLLGNVENFANAIKSLEHKTTDSLLDTLDESGKDTVIGIFQKLGNTQNNRMFGKDLAETSGSIFLFKPGKIDIALIPKDKHLPKIEDHFAFAMSSEDASQYYAKSTPSTQTTSSTAGSNQSAAITASYFLDIDGTASDWYRQFVHQVYIKPILQSIGGQTQLVNQTGKISPIFWSFMVSLPPADFSLGVPGNPTQYTTDLSSMIAKLIGMAGKYDSNYAAPNTSELSSGLFKTMVEAWIIICLNAKRIVQSNIENEVVPTLVEKPLKVALAEAGGTVAPVVNPVNQTTTSDTSIKNEADLLKIASGVIARFPADFPNPGNKFDLATDSGVRDMLKSIMGGNVYQNCLDAISKKGPFEHGKSYNSQGFKDICSYLFGIKNGGSFNDAVKTEIEQSLQKATI